MNEDLLRGVAGELNDAPDAASRVARAKAQIEDTNDRIALEAVRSLQFDSTPYGFPNWLDAADKA
ncbi:MAG: hypothetical protein JWQ24_3935 [Tardiphaga sp.]|nr:hypothetical protein [Tardiphaga sp.]